MHILICERVLLSPKYRHLQCRDNYKDPWWQECKQGHGTEGGEMMIIIIPSEWIGVFSLVFWTLEVRV